MGELHLCRRNSKSTKLLPDVFGEMGLHWLERVRERKGKRRGGVWQGRGDLLHFF